MFTVKKVNIAVSNFSRDPLRPFSLCDAVSGQAALERRPWESNLPMEAGAAS
jgi:hypothetical protein